MKLRRAQFVKMNAHREENPPPREVGCPDYRSCLNEAAYRNHCLDCSQCDSVAASGEREVPRRAPRLKKSRGFSTSRALTG